MVRMDSTLKRLSEELTTAQIVTLLANHVVGSAVDMMTDMMADSSLRKFPTKEDIVTHSLAMLHDVFPNSLVEELVDDELHPETDATVEQALTLIVRQYIKDNPQRFTLMV